MREAARPRYDRLDPDRTAADDRATSRGGRNESRLVNSRGKSPVLIVAMTHLLFRDAIARAIASLRPGIRTIQEAPDALERLVLAAQPSVVIADQLFPAFVDSVPVWLCFDSGDQVHCTVSIHGKTLDVGNIGLHDVIDLIDVAVGAG